MKLLKNPKTLFFACLFVLSLAITVVWLTFSSSKSPDESLSNSPVPAYSKSIDQGEQKKPLLERAISQKKNLAESTTEFEASDVEMLDPTMVNWLVQAVAFDENNTLQLTDTARTQLDQAVELIGLSHDMDRLNAVNAQILTALPPEQAEQVTALLSQYYEYKLIESDFLATREAASVDASMEDHAALVELRKGYLGGEAASILFAEEDRYINYTAELMKLYDRPASEPLSIQEQQTIETELREKYFPQTSGE